MLFYNIYKITWAHDFFKLSYHFNKVFFKFDVSYHVLYTIPVKTINNGKTQVYKNPMRLSCHFLKIFPPMSDLDSEFFNYIFCQTKSSEGPNLKSLKFSASFYIVIKLFNCFIAF